MKYLIALTILVVLGFLLAPFTIVGAGQRAVVIRLGRVERVIDQGIHWRTPIVERVVKLDVQVQKEQVEASAASKDLQGIKTIVAVNYTLVPENVGTLYQNIGLAYKTSVIDPSVQEAVKAATAKYTAEESITKRELVRGDIKDLLITSLNAKAPNLVRITDVSIVDFEFSAQFNTAVEAKVKAEQDALKAKNDLQRIEFEAQQKIATAKAEAEAIKLKSDAANNEKYIQLQQLEVQKEFASKWNGVLPVNLYGSAPIPFLQVGK